MQEYPKILILSHNIFEDTNNIGKTLVSLLSGWPKDKLCQIYLRDDTPSFKYCGNYFRILDKEIVKSYVKGKKAVGTVFSEDTYKPVTDAKVYEDATEKSLYNLGNKRIPSVSLARDLIWKRKSWKNELLKTWLDDQKPDVILFVPNDYELIYPIAEYVSKYLNIPIIPYYMDDAFYFGVFVSVIDFLRRKAIRRKGKKIIRNAKELITIGPKMSEAYSKHFNKKCTELMNSVQCKTSASKSDNEVFTFSYVGNLHSNRWKSLVDIGNAVNSLGIDAVINVYTASDTDGKIGAALANVKCIKLCGKIPAESVEEVLEGSDALLFVESFNKRSKASTMYSLSTKIPEYLNSGRPVFAYGPADISSIEYLKNNDLAVVCTDKAEISEGVKKIFDGTTGFDVERIRQFVRDNHDIAVNREKLKKLIFDRVCQ